MKPTKNKVFCKDCERTKMLFETEKKAENFIKFNKEEIEAESGYSPERSYYCTFCGGWHITSIKEKIGLSKKEQFLEQYMLEKEKKKAANMLIQGQTTIKNNSPLENQEKQNKILAALESQIKEMNASQKEFFFEESISILKKEIEELLGDSADKEKLKDLRQNLEILYVVRKQNGFQKNKNKLDELKEKELEEWRLWAEKEYGNNITNKEDNAT